MNRRPRHHQDTIALALSMFDKGWKPSTIVKALAKRGIKVDPTTVRRWCDPEAAEMDRKHNREASRRKREEIRASKPDNPFKGLTGLSRKVAMLEARIATLETRVAELTKDTF